METIEEWRVIPSHKNYEASNLGRIRRGVPSQCSEAGQIIKPFFAGTKDKQRYSFKAYSDGAKKTVRVHVSICEAFKGERPEGYVCCHNDGDWCNNHISNLRWDTRKGNSSDQLAHGTMPAGEDHCNSKLTWRQVGQIRQLRRGSNLTLAEIAEMYNVTAPNIRSIVNYATWKLKYQPEVYTYTPYQPPTES